MQHSNLKRLRLSKILIYHLQYNSFFIFKSYNIFLKIKHVFMNDDSKDDIYLQYWIWNVYTTHQKPPIQPQYYNCIKLRIWATKKSSGGADKYFFSLHF